MSVIWSDDDTIVISQANTEVTWSKGGGDIALVAWKGVAMATLCQGGIVAVSWTYSETEIWNQGVYRGGDSGLGRYLSAAVAPDCDEDLERLRY